MTLSEILTARPDAFPDASVKASIKRPSTINVKQILTSMALEDVQQ